MRILIVDDSPVAVTLTGEMLSARGHQVVAEARNSAEAMQAYQTHRPDLVMLDLGLGKDNGLEVLKALRTFDPKAKVVVITGNPQAQIREQALAAGALGFLTKPVNIHQLDATLSLAKTQ